MHGGVFFVGHRAGDQRERLLGGNASAATNDTSADDASTGAHAGTICSRRNG
jgi:hypothetical protein